MDELQGNLGIALFLQVGDDTLTHQARRLDNVQHLVIISADNGKLKSELGRIHREYDWFSSSVQTVNIAAFDFDQVDCMLQSSHNAVVSMI